ncbi:MAG: hypothetical protein CMN78_04575 [Spirochaetales bacterium]|nr:hypothetical protein [Spirochaetales bacterium]
MKLTVWFAICIVFLILLGCDRLLDTLYPEPQLHADGEVQSLFTNGSPNVDVVFMGDGYTRRDLLVGGKYESDLLEVAGHLFNAHPYNTYKQYFSAHIVYAESNASGTDVGTDYDVIDTKFDTCLRCGVPESKTATRDRDLAYEYADKAVSDPELVVLVINIDETLGTGGGGFLTMTAGAGGDWKRRAIIHETGHAFGRLGDEYINAGLAALRDVASMPDYPNLDTTGDLGAVKWSHFFGLPKYEMVGAFEGGYYRAAGVWRPEKQSVMGPTSPPRVDRNTIPGWLYRYNAPSREAIVKKIMSAVGIPYSFHAFLENDLIE